MTQPKTSSHDLLRENEQLRLRIAELEGRLTEAEGLEPSTDTQTAQLMQLSADWQSLANSAVDYIIFAAADGTIEYINRVTEKYSVEEVLGRSIYDFLNPIYHDGMRRAIEQVIETGEPTNFENVGEGQGDGPRAYLTRIGPRYREDRIVGVSLFATDVTEQKLIAQRLEESEKLHRALLNSYVDGVALVMDGKLAFVNSAGLQMTGYAAEEIIGRSPAELVTPEERERVGERIAELMRGGEEAAGEYTAVRKDGSTFPMEVRSRKMTYQGSWGLLSLLRDVTNRHEIEKRIRESEEMWRSLVSTAPNYIMLLEPDGTIYYTNRTPAGLALEDALGQKVHRFVEPKFHEAMDFLLAEVVRTGEFHSLECQGLGPHGSTVWYAANLGPFRREDRATAVTCIVTDITDHIQAEEKLQSEQRLLRQLLDLQEQERKFISHEIHDGFVQDVVGAKLFLESGAHQRRQDGGGAEEFASTERLLSKAIDEARRMIGELRPMVIDDEGIVPAVKYLISERDSTEIDIQFEHQLEFERLEPMLEGAVFRIVQESLNNVRRHSQSKTAQVRLHQTGVRLRIEVEDQGVGFDPKLVDQDRFGLRGIRERARLFGGRAEIHSRPGQGTRVQVDLPAKGAEPAEE